MSLRVVLISDHGAHGQCLAQTMIERGLRLDAVLVQSGRVSPFGQGAAKWARSVVLVARRRRYFLIRQKAFYAPLGERVFPCGDMNSRAMLGLLRRLAPDFILVGSGSILLPSVIEVARQGVFNAHPGLLPWMRGSGVVGHALEQGVPVGATLHYIDAGIDTGLLIERRLLPIEQPASTLAHLQDAASELAGNMMSDAVLEIERIGQKPVGTPQTVHLPLWKWPDALGRERQNALATSGRALELFEAWRGWSEGAPNWVLPPDWMDMPLREHRDFVL